MFAKMKILCVVLVTVAYFFLCFNARDIQELRVKHTDNLSFQKVYQVLGFKRLHIIFEGFRVKSLICEVKDDGVVFLPGKHTLLNYNNGTAVLKTPGLLSNLTVRLKCVLNSMEGDDGKMVSLIIQTLIAHRVNVSIDGITLAFKDTKTAGSHFAKHLCDEGTIVDMTCSIFYDIGGLKLRYYDANGTKMIESDQVQFDDQLNFRLFMREENNRSYVECSHVTFEGDTMREFVYRVMFIMKDRNSKYSSKAIFADGLNIRVIVKDMELIEEFVFFDFYDYKFIYGDKLTIRCEKKDNGILHYIRAEIEPKFQVAHGADIELRDIVKTKSIYQFSIDTRYLDNAVMTFFIYDLNNITYGRTHIYFHIDDIGGPAVLGLSQSNILYQYNASSTKWIIHYRYVINQVLNLTCFVKGNSYLQFIDGEMIISSPVLVNTDYGTSYIKYVFYMDAESKDTITCESTMSHAETKSITIVLHQIPELISPQINMNIDGASDIRDNITDGQMKLLEIIGIVVGVLFIIVVCAFYWWRLKRIIQGSKEKELSRSSCECDNRVHELTDQREGHEYASIEYDDNTHLGALTANQGSGSLANSPALPPRMTRSSKSARLQILPNNNRKMEQSRRFQRDNNLVSSTSQSLEETQSECEYDYVYGAKKNSPCITHRH